MALGQHAPMQYARDEYPVSISSVEDNMAAMLHAPQARTNVFAGSADRGIVGQSSATGLEATQVKNRLFPTPFAQRVGRDRKQISLSAMSQAKLAQRRSLLRDIEMPSDTRECAIIRYSTCITFIDRLSEYGEFRLILPFFTLESAQGSANNFTRVLIPSALDFGAQVLIQLLSQVDIASRHTCMENSIVGKVCQSHVMESLSLQPTAPHIDKILDEPLPIGP
jgi:hypothetical protein